MSTQSGISVSDELRTAFQSACESRDVLALKVVIESESLVPSTTLPSTGSDSDWDSIASSLSEHADVPAYVLVRLEASSDWLLACYVPDKAAVRQKMLYSSTKATLQRQLGDSKFTQTMFASTPDELSAAGYRRFMQHQSSTAPLTEREREMAEIRQAEGIEATATVSGARRSHMDASAASSSGSGSGGGSGSAQVGMDWGEGVNDALVALQEGRKRIVHLGLDTKSERIVLLGTPEQLELPSSDPSYTFYQHASGIVFIYSCPSSSPIRSRMVASSSALLLVHEAKRQAGIQVVNKIETSDPEEITEKYIDDECAPAAGAGAAGSAPGSGTATPIPAGGDKPGFARPARPGRRR